MRFSGKVAILTRGGSGIGKETTRRLVAEGAKVAINGRNKAKLEGAAKEIDPSGKNIAILAADIASPDTSQALISLAVERFGRNSHSGRISFARNPGLKPWAMVYSRFAANSHFGQHRSVPDCRSPVGR